MIGPLLRRPRRWLGLLAVPALLVTGCGGDSSSDDENADVSADSGGPSAGDEAEPGVPIADSLVTPPGTRLLGAPFASQGSGFESNPVTLRIDALLQVVGDPLVAFGDLLDQADVAGVPMSVYAHGDLVGPCRVTNAVAPGGRGDRVLLGSEDLPEGPLGTECEASGVSAVSDGVQRRLELRSFVSEATDPYVSFVELTFTEYEITAEPETLYADTVPASLPEGESPVQPPDPPELASLAQPGERLGAPYAPEGEGHQVLEGSLLLAPPSPPTCPTGGFLAVVRAEDELDAAFDRYSLELSGEAFIGVDQPDTDQSFEHDGTQYRYRSYSAAGGGGVRVWASPAPEGGTYLLLSRCND